MHQSDAVFLELCPKLRVRRWRQSLHEYTGHTCIYCGKPSESIDHVWPRSRGGLSVTRTAFRLASPATGTRATPMPSSGIAVNAFTILAVPWPFAPGSTVI